MKKFITALLLSVAPLCAEFIHPNNTVAKNIQNLEQTLQEAEKSAQESFKLAHVSQEIATLVLSGDIASEKFRLLNITHSGSIFIITTLVSTNAEPKSTLQTLLVEKKIDQVPAKNGERIAVDAFTSCIKKEPQHYICQTVASLAVLKDVAGKIK